MKNKFFSLLLSLAIMISALPITVFADEASNMVYTYEGYMVDYNIVNSWDDNQNINITLTNTGDTAIRNWALKYSPCGEITGIWNGEIYNSNIVKNAFYNADIDAGASVNFGYTLKGASGVPDEFMLCSYQSDKPDGFNVNLSVQNSWDGGFSGLITIENTTDNLIIA